LASRRRELNAAVLWFTLLSSRLGQLLTPAAPLSRGCL
jgi:hypothetical protein